MSKKKIKEVALETMNALDVFGERVGQELRNVFH